MTLRRSNVKKIVLSGRVWRLRVMASVLAQLWEDLMETGISMVGRCARGRDHVMKPQARRGGWLALCVTATSQELSQVPVITTSSPPKDGVLPGTCSVSCWLHLLKASSSFKYVNYGRTNSIQASYLFKWIKATGIWKFYIRSFVLTPPPMPSDPLDS